MLKHFISVSFGLSILMSSTLSVASDFHSPRTAALGGAGHAGPMLNDAIFLNPSYTSFLPAYGIGGNYLTFSGPSRTTPPTGEPHGRNYSLSIQDGRNDIFQAGLAYTQREDGTMVHVGASKSFIKRVGFGLGTKLYLNHPGSKNGTDVTFSVSGIPSDQFQTAFIIDNLFESDAGIARGNYREFTIGTKINLQSIVLLYIDPHYTPSVETGKLGVESGIEFVLMSDLFLRLGLFRNSNIPYQASRGRGYGIGLGWMAPRLSLDYAIQRAIEPMATTAHIFGATAFF